MKDIRGLDSSARERIKRAIAKLKEDPRPSGVKRLLGGYLGYMRLRVGDYRVIYTIFDERVIVLVVRVAHRSEVYK